jgi:hypothetical protein
MVKSGRTRNVVLLPDNRDGVPRPSRRANRERVILMSGQSNA